MPNITIGFGAVLCAIGLFGYFGSALENRSPTAFIPAIFGVLLIICGLLAHKANLRKHAMHAAAAVGLIGFIAAAARGLPKIGLAISDDVTLHRAPRLVLLMMIVCLVFVGITVKSFIDARRRRQAGGIDGT